MFASKEKVSRRIYIQVLTVKAEVSRHDSAGAELGLELALLSCEEMDIEGSGQMS